MPSELKQEVYYTFEEWQDMELDYRSELIDGQIYMMSDPTTRHQKVIGELHGQICAFLKGKTCEVFVSPFSVRLHENEDTGYEPDLVVVCDTSKIKKRGCTGAPDLVIEVLSPSTQKDDKVEKYQEYMKAGVKEYWIVNPDLNYVEANQLIDGRYIALTYFENDTAPIQVLQGCGIDLSEVFKKSLYELNDE